MRSAIVSQPLPLIQNLFTGDVTIVGRHHYACFCREWALLWSQSVGSNTMFGPLLYSVNFLISLFQATCLPWQFAPRTPVVRALQHSLRICFWCPVRLFCPCQVAAIRTLTIDLRRPKTYFMWLWGGTHLSAFPADVIYRVQLLLWVSGWWCSQHWCSYVTLRRYRHRRYFNSKEYIPVSSWDCCNFKTEYGC